MQMISYDLYIFLTNEHHPQEVKMRDSIIKPQTLFLLALKVNTMLPLLCLIISYEDQAERIKEVKAIIANITELNIYSN